MTRGLFILKHKDTEREQRGQPDSVISNVSLCDGNELPIKLLLSLSQEGWQ